MTPWAKLLMLGLLIPPSYSLPGIYIVLVNALMCMYLIAWPYPFQVVTNQSCQIGVLSCSGFSYAMV